MRNPGRRDSGDSRQDRSDEASTQAAEGIDATGDGEVAAPSVPNRPHSPFSDDTAPDDTAPDDTAPDDTAPDDTGAAGDATPDDDSDPGTAHRPADADRVADTDPGTTQLHADDPADSADDSPDDDLMFDPLLSDEPIDLAAVRADDALIDALAGGDPAAARGLVDVDDPLIALLAAWAASARPEGPGPAADRPALTVVGGQAGCAAEDHAADDTGTDRVDGADPTDAADAEDLGRTGPTPAVAAIPLRRPVGRPGPATALPPAAALDDATAVSAADEPATVPALFPVLGASRPTGATANEPPTVPALAPVLSGSTAADDGAPDDGAPADSVPAGTAHDDSAPAGTAHDDSAHDRTAPDDTTVRRLRRPLVRGLDRVRIPHRRTAPGARPVPLRHPLRRASVAVVVAFLAVSGAAAAGGTARPGDVGFPMTRVFFAERAKSFEAADVVAAGLTRARVYLEHRRPDLAAQELAAVDAALPDVRDEEGHTGLVDQQQVLETAVALAPPFTPDPTASAEDADRRRGGSDPSVLAELAPDGTTATDGTGSDGTGSGGTGSDGTGSDGTGPDGRTSEKPESSDPPSDSAAPDGTDVLAAPGDRTGGTTGAGRSTAENDAPLATATSTVGGATDQGRASVDPSSPNGTTTAPTSPAGSTRPSAPTSGASATDDPTDPTPTGPGTATSTSPTSTTRAAPAPDRAGDTGSGSVAAVPAGAATAFVVRPAAHHVEAPEPVATADDTTTDSDTDTRSARVVVTTVPPPTPVEPRSVPVAARRSIGHDGRHDVAGTHTSAVREIGGSRADSRLSRAR